MELNELVLAVITSIITYIIIEAAKKAIGFKVKAWAIPLAFLIGYLAGPHINRLWPKDEDKREYVVRQTFDNVNVELDGKDFNGCTFINCKIIFRGEKPFGFSNCALVGNSYFSYDGKASLTFEGLRGIYYADKDVGNYRYYALQTLNEITYPDRVFIVDRKNDTLSVEIFRERIRLQRGINNNPK